MGVGEGLSSGPDLVEVHAITPSVFQLLRLLLLLSLLLLPQLLLLLLLQLLLLPWMPAAAATGWPHKC